MSFKGCGSGKRLFESEAIALEALIQNHIVNTYNVGEGPRNVYLCNECGSWHFTSKGETHSFLDDEETMAKIKKERIASHWERKLK